MEDLVSDIKQYKERINLSDRFNYQFSITDCEFLNLNERNEINSTNNIFQKNIILKRILSSKLTEDFNQPDIHYWIINKWGGINNFKRNEKNDERIMNFINCLENNQNINRNNFSSISSLSKIAAFLKPIDYFIYDSRVIYSLNWLLLKNRATKLKYFPSPVGRNNIINNFNLIPIINFVNINSNPKSLYYPNNIAYQEYCNLLKVISEEVYPDEDKYYLEMLLFVISTFEIFDDIKVQLQIKINNT